MIDRIEIGARIKQAREAQGWTSGQLSKEIQKLIAARSDLRFGDEKKPRKPKAPTRQAIDYWEGGHVPSWEQIVLLAMAFRPEHDEEWIMFGQRRAQQIEQEKTILARIDHLESVLIQTFRAANEEGRKAILASAKGIVRENPAPDATLHPLNPGKTRTPALS